MGILGPILTLVCVGAAVVLAAAAFVSHARPGAGLGLVAHAAGLAKEYDQGRLSELDEQRLLGVVSGARWPLTLFVFATAFVAGASLAWTAG